MSQSPVTDSSLVSINDTISLALGLTSILLSIVTIYVTRKQPGTHSKWFLYIDNDKSDEALLDPDVENIPAQNIGNPNVDAPHEVIGDFLASLERVVNYRRRNV